MRKRSPYLYNRLFCGLTLWLLKKAHTNNTLVVWGRLLRTRRTHAHTTAVTAGSESSQHTTNARSISNEQNIPRLVNDSQSIHLEVSPFCITGLKVCTFSKFQFTLRIMLSLTQSWSSLYWYLLVLTATTKVVCQCQVFLVLSVVAN